MPNSSTSYFPSLIAFILCAGCMVMFLASVAYAQGTDPDAGASDSSGGYGGGYGGGSYGGGGSSDGGGYGGATGSYTSNYSNSAGTFSVTVGTNGVGVVSNATGAYSGMNGQAVGYMGYSPTAGDQWGGLGPDSGNDGGGIGGGGSGDGGGGGGGSTPPDGNPRGVRKGEIQCGRDSVWVAGYGGSCTAICGTYDYEWTTDEGGNACTSGENFIAQTDVEFGGYNIYRYGIRQKKRSGNAILFYRDSQYYCYRNNDQVQDGDSTDLLVGCSCAVPVEEQFACPVAEGPAIANLEVAKIDTEDWTTNLTIAPGEDVKLRWSSNESAASCTAFSPSNGFSTGGDTEGIDETIDEPAEVGASLVYRVACLNGEDVYSDPASVTVQVSDGLGALPTLIASPKYVYPGAETTLEWNTNGSPNSCTLSGPRIDFSSIAEIGEADVVVSGRSTFTLTCPSGSSSVTVYVLPIVQET